MSFMGIRVGIVIRCGTLLGEGKIENTKRIKYYTYKFTIIAAFIMSGLMYILRDHCLRLFTNDE